MHTPNCRQSKYADCSCFGKREIGRTQEAGIAEKSKGYRGSLPLRKKGLAASTINKVMLAGKIAFTWAFQEGYIRTNPSEGLKNFVGKAKERGILTDEETTAIFEQEWGNERS